MKIIFWLLGTLLSVVIGLIPETIMFFTYRLIAPQTDVARILLLALFWVCGSGMCILFAILGVVLFFAITSAVIDAPYL